MKAWNVDANDIHEQELRPFQQNLLHLNAELERFLDPECQDKSIVLAPKGFGKTLLLKAKRLSLQKRYTNSIPSDALVDKPAPTPSVVSGELDDLRRTEDYWLECWVIALIIAILKTTRAHGEAATTGAPPVEELELSAQVQALFRNTVLRSPCDVFDQVFALSRGDYYRAAQDCRNVLLAHFRAIHSQVAVFIDNIDEVYEASLRRAAERIHGDVPRHFWHYAQIGCAMAAWKLHQLNAHVRIYVSLRAEVLERALVETGTGLQLQGSATRIRYSTEDLKHIIEKNICFTDPARLVAPAATTPVARFFGKVSRVVHPMVGEEEDVLDFWLRHTLGRPRDIAVIGGALANLDPSQRTESRIRGTVRQMARTLGITYLAELAPHLEGFDWSLLQKLIPKNVLTFQELAEISARYFTLYCNAHGQNEAARHPFCALYKIGLLGVVGHDPDQPDDSEQKFIGPGEMPLDAVDILPRSTAYLLHPVLDEVITLITPSYMHGMDKNSIVGPGRVWNTNRRRSFVLKGDVVSYSKLQRETVVSESFTRDIEEAVRSAKESNYLMHALVEQGDSVTLIDANPKTVLTAAKAIRHRVLTTYGVQMRFGGDAGFVSVDSQNHTYGLALRTAARLEPFVEAGAIYVTEAFVSEYRQRNTQSQAATLFTDVAPGNTPTMKAPYQDGRYNLAKADEDAVMTTVYRII